jgi:starch phosphorylase
VRDGWWDECFDGRNGWAIASAEEYDDLWQRDHAEAASLFEILEREVVPLFYDRDGDGLPRRWLERVRWSLQTLGPFVCASRMVRDYVDSMYAPAAVRGRTLGADGSARARELAAWKTRVRSGWDGVKLEGVESDGHPADVGGTRTVRARVVLGDLAPADVELQLLHGPVSTTEELVEATVAPMVPEGSDDNGRVTCYQGAFTCEQAGRYGYTVRVVPAHPDLRDFAEVGRITWA